MSAEVGEPHFFEYVSTTPEGTLTLSGSKSADPEDVYVDFTFKLNSNQPFPQTDESEVRLCFEYALNDQFFQKRKRLAFFGKVSQGNFSDYVMATYLAQAENLTDFSWWCSIHLDSYEYHYQWYERDSSVDLLDVNKLESSTAELKFRTKLLDRTAYWSYISWGVFADADDNSTSKVNGETQKGSKSPKYYEILLGDQPAPFADRTFYDTAYWMLILIYFCNYFWVLGLPLMLLLITILLTWGFIKLLIDYNTVHTITADNPYAATWTLDNWWLYPFRQFVVNLFLSAIVVAVSFIPVFNVFFNLGFIGLIYMNMILL